MSYAVPINNFNGDTVMATPTTTGDSTGASGADDDPILPDESSAQPEPAEQEPAAEKPEPTQTNDEANAPAADDAQAGDGELKGWLEKKGLEINFDNPNEVKLATMQLNAEKLMHASTAKASELEKALVNGEAPASDYSDIPSEILDHPFVRGLVDRVERVEQNQGTMSLTAQVNGFLASNPDAAALEDKMAEIVTNRPEVGRMVKAGYLGLEDLLAMAQSTPGALEQAKQDGGREALQKVASKQQAKAVPGNATNSNLATEPEDAFIKAFDAN